MRDIKGDYQRAYQEEYESYRRDGRAEDAKRVAAILRDHYGHKVDDDAAGEGEDAPEHTAAEKPTETATPQKPARAKRAPAKKPAGE
jgi:hypothetical protein